MSKAIRDLFDEKSSKAVVSVLRSPQWQRPSSSSKEVRRIIPAPGLSLTKRMMIKNSYAPSTYLRTIDKLKVLTIY